MSAPIFLDFQATTPLDPQVLEVMLPWLSAPANSHSMQHGFGRAAGQAVSDARDLVAAATGTDHDGVLLTPGATFACNMVLRSFAGPGSRIVVSAIEHPCVAETAQWCEARGACVQIIPVGVEGVIDLDAAYEMVEGASLVSVMAVNNEVGTVQPIRELAEFCEAEGVAFHTDATQALGRIPLDGLPNRSIVTLSSHKAYGPPGIGAIVTTSEVLAGLKPLVIGGGQQDGLHAGTVPTALVVGFGEAARLAVDRREADWAHCADLSERFLSRLASNEVSFNRNGDAINRVPHNLNLSFEMVDADLLLDLLPDVALATGSACSSGAIGRSRVLRAMGLSDERAAGAVRIGFGRTSRAEEIDEAADRIATIVARLARDV